MLLHRPSGAGPVGRSEVASRADAFGGGLWTDLIQKAREAVPQPRSTPQPRIAGEEQERRGESCAAGAKLSRARQELTGATLAPRDEATLDEWTRRRPQERIREIQAKVLDHVPGRELHLDAKRFAECLRSAPAGSSLGQVDVRTRSSASVWTTRRRCCVPDIHVSHHDSTREARRWSPGHRHWYGVPTIGCQDPRQDSLATRLRRRVSLSNLHLPRAQVWICVGHVIRAITDADPMPPCCLWTGLARATTSTGRR